MVVMKFGGTSVADAHPIRRVASLVAAQPGGRVVVTSGLAGVADRLQQVAALAAAGRSDAARGVFRGVVERHRALAAALCGAAPHATLEFLDTLQRDLDVLLADTPAGSPLPPASIDAIAAAGPLMSSRVVAGALAALQIDAVWIDARGLVETNGDHGAAAITLSGTADRIEQQLRPLLAAGRVPVVAGGVGASDAGTTTTLGHDGGDLTAAALAVELDALEVQLWTDVEGVRAADPRVLRRAQPLAHLSYGEARDLAGFGARVLHPGAIELAATCRVPIRVRSSRRPEADGTIIGSGKGLEPRRGPAGLACRRALVVAIFTPRSGSAQALLDAAISVAQQLTPGPVLALTVDDRMMAACDDGNAVAALAAGLRDAASVRTYPDTALLAAVGDGLCDRPGAAEDMAAVLDGIAIHATARTATAGALLAVVDDADIEEAMTRMHDRHYPAAEANGTAGPATLAEASS